MELLFDLCILAVLALLLRDFRKEQANGKMLGKALEEAAKDNECMNVYVGCITTVYQSEKGE